MWNSLSTRFWTLQSRTPGVCATCLRHAHTRLCLGHEDIFAQSDKHCIWAYTHATAAPIFLTWTRYYRDQRSNLAVLTTTSTPSNPASKDSQDSAPVKPFGQHIQTTTPCLTSTPSCQRLLREISKAKSPQCPLTALTWHVSESTQSAQSTTTSTPPALPQDSTKAQSHALEQNAKDASVHRTHMN